MPRSQYVAWSSTFTSTVRTAEPRFEVLFFGQPRHLSRLSAGCLFTWTFYFRCSELIFNIVMLMTTSLTLTSKKKRAETMKAAPTPPAATFSDVSTLDDSARDELDDSPHPYDVFDLVHDDVHESEEASPFPDRETVSVGTGPRLALGQLLEIESRIASGKSPGAGTVSAAPAARKATSSSQQHQHPTHFS